MIHEILPVGLLQCNCSILGDEASRSAIVVDPGDNIAQIIDILKHHHLRVEYIVVTHAHVDHIGGARGSKTSPARRFISTKATLRFTGMMTNRLAGSEFRRRKRPRLTCCCAMAI